MRQLVLLKSHPYVETFEAHIRHFPKIGVWTVKWRDFLTVKQDQDCASEEEACALAQKLRDNCHLVPIEEDWPDKSDLFDAIEFWKNVRRDAWNKQEN